MERIASQQFWSGLPVLITGGTGFIGSQLAASLAQLEAHVVVLDIKKEFPRLSVGTDETLQRVCVVQGDVRDGTLLQSLFSEHDIQTVFHLAAVSEVGDAAENPTEAFETNIRGTWQVLETFRKCRGTQGQVIVDTSDKAYGEHEELPYREEYPLRGENPYDCSKSCADLVSQVYLKAYGLPVSVVRSGNVYGGGDTHFSRLIPGTIKSVLMNESPRIRSDGSYQRDYIYIEDIVTAHILIAEKMAQEGAAGEIFNLGMNAPFRVIDVVEKIISLMGASDIRPTILGEAQHEIHDQYLDSSKAKKLLGWEPTHTLEDGLKPTIAWYKEFLRQ